MTKSSARRDALLYALCGIQPVNQAEAESRVLAECNTLAIVSEGWARGEREGYGEPCDVTSLSLSLSSLRPFQDRFRSEKDALQDPGPLNS